MESFFRSLEAEWVYLTRYPSCQEAKTELFDYIRFYNHRLRQSTLGYLSPMECERRNASSSSQLPALRFRGRPLVEHYESTDFEIKRLTSLKRDYLLT